MSARSATSAPNLRIACVQTLDELDGLADEWDDLLERSEIDGFFVSRRWSRAWYAATEIEYRMLVVTARDERDRLVGIAPLAVNRPTGELHLVGHSYWGEYVGFIVDRSDEFAVSDALCAALARAYRGTWDRLRFRFVGIESRFLRLLVDGFERHGVSLRETNVEAAPYVALPDDLASYFAGKTSHFAKRIDYLERRLAKEGTVELKIAGEDFGPYEAIEEFWRLYKMRWPSSDDAFVRFHREFAVDLVDRREAIIAVLYVGGKPVAARYDLAFAEKVSSYLGGWDDAWIKFEVGNVLLGRLLGVSIARGFREYDFLAGDAAYKRRWATGLRAMADIASVTSFRGDVMSLLPSATTALGQVDDLSFVRVDASDADPSAERCVPNGCRAVVSGWMAMPEPGATPVMAFALLGSRRFELAYGLPRRDVAEALHDERRTATGFQGVFALTDVAPGTYELSIGIVHTDGTRCALLPARFKIDVRPDS